MKTITLKLDNDYDLLALEQYHFETGSYQNIINHLMDTHKNDVAFLQTPIWKSYMSEHQKVLYLFEKEKKALSNYLYAKLRNDYELMVQSINEISWEVLDFDTKEIVINIAE